MTERARAKHGIAGRPFMPSVAENEVRYQVTIRRSGRNRLELTPVKYLLGPRLSTWITHSLNTIGIRSPDRSTRRPSPAQITRDRRSGRRATKSGRRSHMTWKTDADRRERPVESVRRVGGDGTVEIGAVRRRTRRPTMDSTHAPRDRDRNCSNRDSDDRRPRSGRRDGAANDRGAQADDRQAGETTSTIP